MEDLPRPQLEVLPSGSKSIGSLPAKEITRVFRTARNSLSTLIQGDCQIVFGGAVLNIEWPERRTPSVLSPDGLFCKLKSNWKNGE